MNNCQCPAPDYINVPGEHGFTDTIYLGWGEQPVLHGKKGTRACCKCEKLLCQDCVIVIEHDGYSWFYCQTCAEKYNE